MCSAENFVFPLSSGNLFITMGQGTTQNNGKLGVVGWMWGVTSSGGSKLVLCLESRTAALIGVVGGCIGVRGLLAKFSVSDQSKSNLMRRKSKTAAIARVTIFH